MSETSAISLASAPTALREETRNPDGAGASAAACRQRQPRLPPWLWLLLRLAATVGLLAVVLSGIDWPSFNAVLAAADWRWWAAGFVLNIAIQAVAGIRWSALARPVGFLFPTWLFVWRFFEGVFFNLCLPSSIGGDVVKAYRLADTNSGRLLAACTVLADRLTGLSALGVLAGAALAAIEFSLSLTSTVAVAVMLLVAVLTGFRLLVGSLDRVLELFPMEHAARSFIAQLLPYQLRPHLMTRAVAWSLVVQVGASTAVALIARGIGVSLHLGVWFSVVPLVSLAMVVPLSINGVGVREGGLAVLLAPWGVPKEQAVAIGLLWFLATILTGLIGGGLFLLDRRPVQAGHPPAQAAKNVRTEAGPAC
jgi:uncharacterized membrane protein YbhN (UPF0104 family)